MLDVEAAQTLGAFSLEAGFKADGGVTALFGRSGSGKTSLLRIIAGLSRPDRGRVVFEGDVLLDTERGIFVPKHRRRFGYVFQDARLFPHLTVRQNLSYGRWLSSQRGDGAEAGRITEMLGIGHLLTRRPSGLSGGERQRVAIGRALLSAPRLLLMDEPLAALDEERKAEILPYLERLRDEVGVPIIYVSHSVQEVARLADRVAMMREGRIEAFGPPTAMFTRSGADLVDRREAGAVLKGRVVGVDLDYGLVTVALSGARLMIPAHHLGSSGGERGREVRLHLPERDVMIATVRPEGVSALNIIDGEVVDIDAAEDGTVLVRVKSGTDMILARITRYSAERLGLRGGLRVHAVVKTVALDR